MSSSAVLWFFIVCCIGQVAFGGISVDNVKVRVESAKSKVKFTMRETNGVHHLLGYISELHLSIESNTSLDTIAISADSALQNIREKINVAKGRDKNALEECYTKAKSAFDSIYSNMQKKLEEWEDDSVLVVKEHLKVFDEIQTTGRKLLKRLDRLILICSSDAEVDTCLTKLEAADAEIQDYCKSSLSIMTESGIKLHTFLMSADTVRAEFMELAVDEISDAKLAGIKCVKSARKAS